MNNILMIACVDRRDMLTGRAFIRDLEQRLAHRVQLTTDGFAVYLDAVQDAFGSQVDFGQDVGFGETYVVSGDPDPGHMHTTFVERQNLTMRMCMRRFTRATNGYSKKATCHALMVCLYALYYNFVRIHESVRTTPAMAAGIDDTLHDVGWIADLVAEQEERERPKHRGPYKRRGRLAA